MVATKDVKVISVNGKSYAVGLFWQPVQVEQEYLKEINVAVQTVVIGANLYCLKKGTASQYGLGYTSYGQKVGMLAGASGIASALRDKSSAVCVFKIPEGYWFITIRNNLILSEEDTVYTSEDEAKEAFNSMLSIPDWGYKIAPSEWNIEDTKEIPVAELLSKGQAVELKSIEKGSLRKIIIFLILGVLGAYYYYDMQQKKLEEERLARERRMAAAKKKLEEAAKPPPPPPPAPWESLTDITDMAKKCTILIVNSTSTIPGWDLKDSVCMEKNLKSNWRRGYGTAGWIFDAQRFGSIPEKMVLTPDNTAYNSVSGILDIPFMKHINQEPTLQKQEIQQKLNDLFQGLKLNNFRLSDEKTQVKDPNNPEYIKDYAYTAFNFTDDGYRLPIDWVKMFKDITAIEFTSISWNNTSRKWSYVGKIYELTPQMIAEKQKQAEQKAKEEEQKRLQEEKKRLEEAQKEIESKLSGDATSTTKQIEQNKEDSKNETSKQK